MKRLLRPLGSLILSRATSPVIIAIFLLVYIVIAFFTEEALTTLMELTRRNIILLPLLALLPLNSAGRIIIETRRFIQRRRAVSGDLVDVPPTLFNETVSLAVSPAFSEVKGMLDASGYKTRQSKESLAAWRGVTSFPARLLFLSSMFCLFVGILISLVSRTSYRGSAIEGVPLPVPSAHGGVVERIRLEKSSGRILSQELIMDVAPSAPGEARTSFGIYPPAMYRGYFVYPRYLGVALLVQFSAPDLASGYEDHAILNIYPPGKEASLQIPESPYRLMLSLAGTDDGSDPFVTGHMVFIFKLLKDKDVVFSGKVPGGGEFSRDGYHLYFPDFRRMVITDFIRDYGVLFIWTAFILLGASVLFWLPVRIFIPRRELLFIRQGSDAIQAYTLAEGKERLHDGLFNGALDFIETKKPDGKPST